MIAELASMPDEGSNSMRAIIAERDAWKQHALHLVALYDGVLQLRKSRSQVQPHLLSPAA